MNLFRSLGLTLLLFPASLLASDNWDSRFGTAPYTDAPIYALATQGNQVYVGGEFTTISGLPATGLAKWNGTAWETVGGGVDGYVYAIAISGTNVYVAGSFTQAGTVPALNIALWNGSTWSALGNGIDDDFGDAEVYALAVSGSTLYAGGYFNVAGSATATNIAKWNGTTWSAQGKGLNYVGTNTQAVASVSALAFDGTNVYAGGFFNRAGTQTVTNIAKWNGTAWSKLAGGLDYVAVLSSDTSTPSVATLALNGSLLYAGGTFNISGSQALNYLAVWNGTNWSAGLSGTDDDVESILVTTNGTYIGGSFTTVDGVEANGVAHWNGSNWDPLDTGSDGSVLALALSGGRLFAGGNFGALGETQAVNFGLWDGNQWTAAIPSGANGILGSVNGLAVTGANIYVGGAFDHAGSTAANNVARWNGTVWQALGGGVDGPVFSVAVNGNNFLAGGSFVENSSGATNIALWNGTSWQALGNGVGDSVNAVLFNGTNIFIGGNFTNSGTTALYYVAQWNGTSWQPLGGGFDGPVNALAAIGTDIYAGGSFGNVASNIARWNGSQWLPLGTGLDQPVQALAVQGANLLVGGSFTNAGGVLVNNLARWNGAGWSDVGGGTDGGIGALAAVGNNLFVSGTFANAGTTGAANIAKWNGTTWTPLGAGLNSSGFALAADATNVYAGGAFTSAGAEASFSFGIWNDLQPYVWISPASLDQPVSAGTNLIFTVTALGATPLSYQWQRNGINISGATTTSYTRSNVQNADAGLYTVLVANAYGTNVSDPASVFLDGATVFTDNFESGTVTNWTTVTGGTALTVASAPAHSGTHSALCSVSTAKMYHNLGVELDGHTRATFWMFDTNSTQNRWFGEVRGYTGGGYGSGTLKQTLGIGRYNAAFGTETGDLAGETAIATNYQGQLLSGTNQGYLNLNQPSDPGRTNGWHKFQIERQADGTTIDYFVDDDLRDEESDASPVTWDSTSIGSVGTGATNGNVWFDDVLIEYLDPPTITVQPVDHTTNAGSTVVFNVTATGNFLTYQWQLNGLSIAGATMSQLSVANAQAASAGNYSVAVANGIGTTMSDSAALSLYVKPSILVQPQGQTAPAGSNLALQVIATGTPSSLAYQWRRNGANVANATQSELALLDAATNNAGSYTVVITNVAGVITSAVALVTITNAAPVIVSQPQDITVNQGAAATFAVAATGSEPRAYQWRLNGSNISGATNTAYRRSGLQPGDVGSYSVVVTNAFGQATSANAVLFLNIPPTITTQPQGLTTLYGSNITLSVVAAGTAPLNYQWRFNGTNIDGEGDSTLSLTDVQSSDTGSYSVLVQNIAGTIISSNAVLIVNGPPSILQSPQDQSVSAGSNATFTVLAASTTALAYQWLLNGTNLAGATTSAYVQNNVQSANTGFYSVTVSNVYGGAVSDQALLTLDGVVVFFDGFESNNLAGWTNLAGATSLTVSTNQAHGGTNSALCDISSDKMYHALPYAVENHCQATFWIYDDQGPQTRWFGEVRGYGGNYAATPNQVLAIGRYDAAFPTNQTGDLNGGLVDTNYYQAQVVNGDNAGFLNLNVSGAPTRSVGWHKFVIEREADGVTIDFYMDNVAAGTVYDADDVDWDAVTIGSTGTDSTNGNAWFDDVKVEYLDVPQILTDPQDYYANLGGTATFSVEATGNVTGYQWQFNGTNIAGATTSSLTLNNVQTNNLGNYSVWAMNGIGPALSGDAILDTNVPPAIVTSPVSQTVLRGTEALLSVDATGTDPLAYQWYLNNTPITGATDSLYDLVSASLSDSGTYTVVVTNGGGSVTSLPATLLVRLPQAPKFQMSINSNQYTVTMSGESNGNYTIQTSTNLVQWIQATNLTLTNNAFLLLDSPTNRFQFYRAIGQ